MEFMHGWAPPCVIYARRLERLCTYLSATRGPLIRILKKEKKKRKRINTVQFVCKHCYLPHNEGMKPAPGKCSPQSLPQSQQSCDLHHQNTTASPSWVSSSPAINSTSQSSSCSFSLQTQWWWLQQLLLSQSVYGNSASASCITNKLIIHKRAFPKKVTNLQVYDSNYTLFVPPP